MLPILCAQFFYQQKVKFPTPTPSNVGIFQHRQVHTCKFEPVPDMIKFVIKWVFIFNFGVKSKYLPPCGVELTWLAK